MSDENRPAWMDPMRMGCAEAIEQREAMEEMDRLQAELEDVRDHQLGVLQVAYDLARDRADALQAIVDKLREGCRSIDLADNRAMAVDGDIPPTWQMLSDAERQQILSAVWACREAARAE